MREAWVRVPPGAPHTLVAQWLMLLTLNHQNVSSNLTEGTSGGGARQQRLISAKPAHVRSATSHVKLKRLRRVLL